MHNEHGNANAASEDCGSSQQTMAEERLRAQDVSDLAVKQEVNVRDAQMAVYQDSRQLGCRTSHAGVDHDPHPDLQTAPQNGSKPLFAPGAQQDQQPMSVLDGRFYGSAITGPHVQMDFSLSINQGMAADGHHSIEDAPRRLLRDFRERPVDSAKLAPIELHETAYTDQNSILGEGSIRMESGKGYLSSSLLVAGSDTQGSGEDRSRTPSLHVKSSRTGSVDENGSKTSSPFTDIDSFYPSHYDAKSMSGPHLTDVGHVEVTSNNDKGISSASPPMDMSRPFKGGYLSSTRTSSTGTKRRTQRSTALPCAPVVTMKTEIDQDQTFGISTPCVEPDDVESLILARALQDREFGLRRRSR